MDDEIGIIDSLSVVLRRNSYEVTGVSSPTDAIELIRIEVMCFINSENAFILVDNTEDTNNIHNSIFREIGQYNKNIEDFMAMLNPELMERIGYARMNRKVEKMKTGVILPLINEYKQNLGIIYISRFI